MKNVRMRAWRDDAIPIRIRCGPVTLAHWTSRGVEHARRATGIMHCVAFEPTLALLSKPTKLGRNIYFHSQLDLLYTLTLYRSTQTFYGLI